ncbi:MAG: 6-bladed beta-propeller [Mongoliitalea sp.]
MSNKYWLLSRLLLSVCFLHFGCKQSVSDKGITVDLDTAVEVPLSTYFEEISYLFLDYPEGEPIVNAYKSVLTDEYFFVESRERAAVFQYDRKGNLLRVLRNYGEGPEQWMLIDQLYVKNDQLVIHCNYLKKYLRFSMEGELVDQGKLAHRSNDYFEGDGYELYYFQNGFEDTGYKFLRVGQDGTEDFFIKVKKGFENAVPSSSVRGFQDFPSNKSIVLIPSHSNEMYRFDEQGFLKDSLSFHFGRHHIDDQTRLIYTYPAEAVYKFNDYIKETGNVRGLFGTVWNRSGGLVSFTAGFSTKFAYLTNQDELVSVVNSFINDLDGLNIRFRFWITSSEEIGFFMDSREFLKAYSDSFLGKKVEIRSGNVHDFYRKNKEKLQDEVYVAVILKLRKD